MPNAIAVACPKQGQTTQVAAGSRLDYDQITFAELEESSQQIACGMVAAGINPGDRIAMMVPPGIEFVKHVFALYKTGAITILIDPGMGRKNMIHCLAAAEPVGLVGIPKAHVARVVFRSKLKRCRKNVVVGGFFPWCDRSSKFKNGDSSILEKIPADRENSAAIIFTTGSTGPPKGVLYRHRNFIEQSQQIRDYFEIKPGTVDVSGFPLFALFNTAMGTTTVFPEMDATRPAEIYPPNLIDAVEQFNADQSFGSPALWNTVSNYCEQHGHLLPTVKRVLTAGAPVPPHVLRRVRNIIADDGDVFTPYGATEALPVACNSATMVLGETAAKTDQGAGTCVGQKFSQIDWRLTAITDLPIDDISECEIVPQGEIGELMVRGAVVTEQYVTRVEANRDHKVKDGNSFWHRMGDVGYFDDQGRFWFCGRKGHRLQTADGVMFTVPIEAVFNTMDSVYRSALVGVGTAGAEKPVLVVEPHPEHWPANHTEKQKMLERLKQKATQLELTKRIETFLLHRSLPVDIRHNSKIFREQLKVWATAQVAAAESQTGT